METATPSTAQPAKPMLTKPRYWKRTLGVAALVLLSLPVIYYFVAGWLGDREMARLCAEIEADEPHWQWEDLLAHMPPAPDEENALVQIRKVRGMLQKTPFAIAPVWDTPAKQKALEIRNAQLSPDNVALLRAAFAPLDPKLLPEARKLKDMPKGRMKIDPAINPFLLIVPEVQEAREVMRLLDTDTLLRTHDYDSDGAVESWHALLNTSHAIEDNPTLIGQLVRMAGQAIAITALERMLGQGELSEPDLAKMQALLQREAGDNLLYFGMRGERAINHRMYIDLRDGKTTTSQLLGGIGATPPSAMERALDLFPGILLKDYPQHLRLFNEMVQASKLKESERMEAMAKIDQKARNSRGILTRLLMPATQKITEASQRTQAHLRCAIVAVAVERYRLKIENWPRGFDDLLKERLLTEIPSDPWDGQPLRFKRTPTGVILYSVSHDRIDNQGKLSSNFRTPGTDFGIELWDRQLRAVAPPVEVEK